MEVDAAPPRLERIAAACSYGLCASLSPRLRMNFGGMRLTLGDLARRVQRRLSEVVRPSKQFPGSAKYWEDRYGTHGNSGVDSYGKFAAFKAEVINTFVADRGVQSVIEFGCGDANQLMLARYPTYAGYDVSDTAVRQCCTMFAGDQTKTFDLHESVSR